MSTADSPDRPAPSASDVAARLRRAGFVRLTARADGDAVAATGLLASALDDHGTPFQATVDRFTDPERTTDADLTVAVGYDAPVADLSVSPGDDAASGTAFAIARELDADPDAVLALAGSIASPAGASGAVREAAEDTGLARRPGLVVPTADAADGLVHSTLIHGPSSGDPEAVAELFTTVGFDPDSADERERRRLASLVAIETVGHPDATERASDAIGRAVRPYDAADRLPAPFVTVGGYADVLDLAARESPGTALALVLGHDAVADRAIDAWRARAGRAHRGLEAATADRHRELYVVRSEDDRFPVEAAARMARDFRSPEPVVLAIRDGRAAVATRERPVGPIARAVADAVADAGESRPRIEPANGAGTEAGVRFSCGIDAVVTAVREAL